VIGIILYSISMIRRILKKKRKYIKEMPYGHTTLLLFYVVLYSVWL